MARVSLLVLTMLALAAHHLRAGEPGLVLVWAGVPLLAALRRRFVPWVIAGLALVGVVVWLDSALVIVTARVATGRPWGRAAVILGVVAALTALNVPLWLRAAVRRRYGAPGEALGPPLAAFGLTAGLLAFVQLGVPRAALVLERFGAGGGWLHVLWIAVYAAWLARVVAVPKHARTWRPRVWVLFSVVFYGQLLLGLAGIDRLLMTGTLHLPVPAIIVAGPVYRGHGLFMATLFAASVVLVGPAWCSWLCYLGGWDNLAALAKRRAGTLPPWRGRVRLGILVGVVAVAWLLGTLGIPGGVAAALGGAFGLAGVGLMATASRRTGVMVHCTAFCPIGWLATRLGRINPFRIRIDDTCTDCMACTRFCRYDALTEDHIRARKVGEACTLCGDCVTVCQKTQDIHYHFPGLRPDRARTAFLVLVVSLHATFLGVAMI